MPDRDLAFRPARKQRLEDLATDLTMQSAHAIDGTRACRRTGLSLTPSEDAEGACLHCLGGAFAVAARSTLLGLGTANGAPRRET